MFYTQLTVFILCIHCSRVDECGLRQFAMITLWAISITALNMYTLSFYLQSYFASHSIIWYISFIISAFRILLISVLTFPQKSFTRGRSQNTSASRGLFSYCHSYNNRSFEKSYSQFLAKFSSVRTNGFSSIYDSPEL